MPEKPEEQEPVVVDPNTANESTIEANDEIVLDEESMGENGETEESIE